jgi:hypothetical protein
MTVAPVPNASQEAKEVATWMRRIDVGKTVVATWKKQLRIEDCYQYWRGEQRTEPMDGNERKAQHNKIHPEVEELMVATYFNEPYGKVVAKPERADTPRETISNKAKLLQDTGVSLVKDKSTGFKENTDLAFKESFWALGVVEVGYSADYLDNTLAPRPDLQETKETDLPTPVVDQVGLEVDENSDVDSMKMEIDRLRQSLRSEQFYVKFITANQIIISGSDKAILLNNDFVGYWEDYPLQDIKKAPGYINTEDLKSGTDELAANDSLGSVDRVRIYRIWDLRTMTKYVLAQGHDKILMKRPFQRCPLKFLRHDIDPYHFLPVPPVYLLLDSQDEYNDSREYLRKQRISTVQRYTYDEEAITADDAAKFQSRDMNLMIPRRQGTRSPIEPVAQPSTASTAIQTLSLSRDEFTEAGTPGGDPLNPATQTATRVMVANAKTSAVDDSRRTKTAYWLAEIIEEMILLAVENMNLVHWIARNVDLDSPMALAGVSEVSEVYEQIQAERLRDATLGINWHVEVDIETLTPVAEAERGQKLMQVLNFMSNPQAAMLLANVPTLLKRVLALAGIKAGEDIDALMDALAFIVQMNMQTVQKGVKPTGTTPAPGEKAGPVPASPKAPEAPGPEAPPPSPGGPSPVSAGVAGG